MLFYALQENKQLKRKLIKSTLEVSCSSPLTNSKRAVTISVLTDWNSQRVPQNFRYYLSILVNVFIVHLLTYLFIYFFNCARAHMGRDNLLEEASS